MNMTDAYGMWIQYMLTADTQHTYTYTYTLYTFTHTHTHTHTYIDTHTHTHTRRDDLLVRRDLEGVY